MIFGMQNINYALERYEELVGEAEYERRALRSGWNLDPIRRVLRPYAERLTEGLAHQAELCLEAGPACEMLFSA